MEINRQRLFSQPLLFILFLAGIGLTCLFTATTLLFATEGTRPSVTLLSPVVTARRNEPNTEHPLKQFIDSHRSTDSYPPTRYFPKTITALSSLTEGISVDAYAVMDINTHELLLAKNLTREHPIASVTKVMTTLIALEYAPLDLEVTVSSAAASIGEASMGSTAGERYTLHDLLYGAMLPSGNDAAETIAEAVGKYDESFADFADWDFWLRMGIHGKLHNIPEYFLCYRMWSQGASFTKQRSTSVAALRIVRQYRCAYPRYWRGLLIALLYSTYTHLPERMKRFLNGPLSRMKKRLFSRSS